MSKIVQTKELDQLEKILLHSSREKGMGLMREKRNLQEERQKGQKGKGLSHILRRKKK
jgi:hypothetical protein